MQLLVREKEFTFTSICIQFWIPQKSTRTCLPDPEPQVMTCCHSVCVQWRVGARQGSAFGYQPPAGSVSDLGQFIPLSQLSFLAAKWV